MYKNIRSNILHNGESSDSFMSQIGVPKRQGENLSPALFSLFLNDLQSYMQSYGNVGIDLKDIYDSTLWL
jgi:hypothetical protein